VAWSGPPSGNHEFGFGFAIANAFWLELKKRLIAKSAFAEADRAGQKRNPKVKRFEPTLNLF